MSELALSVYNNVLNIIKVNLSVIDRKHELIILLSKETPNINLDKLKQQVANAHDFTALRLSEMEEDLNSSIETKIADAKRVNNKLEALQEVLSIVLIKCKFNRHFIENEIDIIKKYINTDGLRILFGE